MSCAPSATGRDHAFERVPMSAAATNAGTWKPLGSRTLRSTQAAGSSSPRLLNAGSSRSWAMIGEDTCIQNHAVSHWGRS